MYIKHHGFLCPEQFSIGSNFTANEMSQHTFSPWNICGIRWPLILLVSKHRLLITQDISVCNIDQHNLRLETPLIYCNRDTPLNRNEIVITSQTMGKYSKTVDDSQYRVDFVVIWSRILKSKYRSAILGNFYVCTTHDIIGITNSLWWSGHPDKLL